MLELRLRDQRCFGRVEWRLLKVTSSVHGLLLQQVFFDLAD